MHPLARFVAVSAVLGAGVLFPGPCGAAGPAWDMLTLVAKEPGADRRTTTVTNFDETRRVVATRIPYRVTYPVDVPEGGFLDFGYSIQSRTGAVDLVPEAKPVRFRVVLSDTRGVDHTLHEHVVDIRDHPADRQWFDVRVNLAEYGGRHATLTLEATLSGDPAERAASTALFSAPRILKRASPGDVSLLLVTIDCLRADHVGTYGYARRTTPIFDQLAAEGIRFAESYATASTTVPAVSQLYTSDAFPVPGQPTFLTPIAAAGIPTAAITNGASLAFWLARSGVPLDDVASGPLTATAITDHAIAWLRRRPRTRFALHLHYGDACPPYAPPEPYARLFIDTAYLGPVANVFDDADGTDRAYGTADRARIVSLYDGAIRYIDSNVGRLLELLKGEERLDRTVVVVTADHGEELWDHGRLSQVHSLHDAQLHVPLVVRLPGAAHAGTVIGRPASTIDIAPALLEWSGLTPPPTFTGHSLAQAVARPDLPADDLLATATTALFPTRYALRTPDAKLIETANDGAVIVYDLNKDPSETRNVLLSNPAAADLLSPRLAARRVPLQEQGIQVRIVGPVAGVAPFRFALQGIGDSALFDTLDRTSGPLDTRVGLSRDGRWLRVKGKTDADGRSFRVDRNLPVLDTASGRPDLVRASLVASGVSRPEMIRIGSGGHLPATRIFDAIATDMDAEDAPSCPPPATGVRVCVWRARPKSS